jgi:hypothetical protein
LWHDLNWGVADAASVAADVAERSRDQYFRFLDSADKAAKAQYRRFEDSIKREREKTQH